VRLCDKIKGYEPCRLTDNEKDNCERMDVLNEIEFYYLTCRVTFDIGMHLILE